MAKVVDQNIPAEMTDAYDASLHRAAVWIPGSTIRQVRHRVPFRIPHMQNKSLHSPSAAQREVRRAFKRCVNCFKIQPDAGGVTPPAEGPRNRSWWYNDSLGSGLFYYDYFIQQSMPHMLSAGLPDWCKGDSLLKDFYGQVTTHFPDRGMLDLGLQYYESQGQWQQRVYVRFDISSLPATTKDICLKFKHKWVDCFDGVYPNVGNVTTIYANAYLVPDASGDWTTKTWNNQPVYGKSIAQFQTDGNAEGEEIVYRWIWDPVMQMKQQQKTYFGLMIESTTPLLWWPEIYISAWRLYYFL